ncbi:MAG: glycosyltransferase family 9 protein [Candidatus Firestonebacteria bacterium]
MRRVEELLRVLLLAVLHVFIKNRKINTAGIDLKQIKKVLVVRQHNERGDILLMVPMLRAIKQKIPEVDITLITRNFTAELMKNNPYVNEILIYDSKNFLKHPWTAFSFFKKIRIKKMDLAIVPSTVSFSLTSALISHFSKAKIKVGTNGKHFGFYGNTDFLFNLNVLPIEKHQVDLNLDYVRILGIDTNDKQHLVELTEEEIQFGKNFIAQNIDKNNKLLVAIHPGAGKLPNRWPVEKFAQLVELLEKEMNASIIVMCGPNEKELVSTFLKSTTIKPVIVPQIPIRQLAAIIKQCKLFICNDTGVLHIAAGVNTSTVAIFGQTNPKFWNPIGSQHLFVYSKDGSCGSVEVSDVFESCKKLLNDF